MIIRELVTSIGFKVDKKGLDDAEKRFSRLGNTASNVSNRFAGLGRVLAGAFSIGAIVKIGSDIFKTNMEFERLAGALKVATGSTEAAADKMKELQKFAATTPYDVQQAVQAFLTLKNLGLDPSVESLKSFGNTASSMGKGLQQMIEAVADASTGEFERLKEFGIKANAEGKDITFTFQGVTTTVKKNAKDIQKYLLNIGNTKFAGAMEEQMNRLPGIVSNFQDSIQAFFKIMGDSGLVDGIKAIFQALSLGTEGSDDLAKSLGEVLGAALRKIAGWITKIRDGIDRWTRSMGGLQNALKLTATAATILMAIFAVNKIYGAITAFLSLASAIRAVGVAAYFANLGIGLIPALVIAAAAAIGVAAGLLIRHWEEVKSAFMNAADTVIQPWFDVFSAFFAFVKNGFMESAQVAAGFINPFKTLETLKKLKSGEAFSKTGSSLQNLGNASGTLANRGVSGGLPLIEFWNEFGKNMAPALSKDWSSVKNATGLGGPPATSTPGAVSKNVNVKSNVNVMLPQGSLRDEVTKAVLSAMNTMLRQADNANSATPI